RNGIRDTGEAGIGGVAVTLSGAGSGTATTAADGSYTFANLNAGSYSVTAPTTAAGKALFTTSPLSVVLAAGEQRPNVNFGYVPPPQQDLSRGDTGTIGFWGGNNGQALILAVNGGRTAKNLATWLATNFPYLYGAN